MDNKELKQEHGETELLYNTRSEEAQEVIGRMPHWIIRWGITMIGVFILSLFILAASIKYPETVVCEVRLSPLSAPTIISAPADGIIKKIFTKDSQIVSLGEVMAVFKSDSTGEEGEVTASVAGKLFFFTELKPDMHVSKKQPLFAIKNENNNNTEVDVVGMIGADKRDIIFAGQTVNLQFPSFPAERYGLLTGRISRIAPLSFNNRYLFNISLEEEGLKTSTITEPLSGMGTIIVKDKTILDRLLEQVKI